MAEAKKQILITGANDGIGLALAKQLTKDYGVKVFLGSRNEAKGAKAVEEVKKHNGDADDSVVELVVIDVTKQDTITAAADNLKQRGIQLYGLVNNAGIGFNASTTPEQKIDTNYYGAKRVTQAFLPLLQADGRIVMTGSGSGPMTVRHMPAALQKKFALADSAILAELETTMDKGGFSEYDTMDGYGISKAMLHTYATVLAKEQTNENGEQHCRCYSVSPGFIHTKMTRQFAPEKQPHEGTVSLRHCLFDATKEQSGWYFGSDAKRSPIHACRDPGDPEFDGIYPFQNKEDESGNKRQKVS